MNWTQFDVSTLANDIALVRLRQPASDQEHIRRVCLPDRRTQRRLLDELDDGRCIVTGWGRRSEGESDWAYLTASRAAMQPRFHLQTVQIDFNRV